MILVFCSDFKETEIKYMKITENELKNFIEKFKELEQVNLMLAEDLLKIFGCQLSCKKDINIVAKVMAEEPKAFMSTLKTFQNGINQSKSLNLGR